MREGIKKILFTGRYFIYAFAEQPYSKHWAVGMQVDVIVQGERFSLLQVFFEDFSIKEKQTYSNYHVEWLKDQSLDLNDTLLRENYSAPISGQISAFESV